MNKYCHECLCNHNFNINYLLNLGRQHCIIKKSHSKTVNKACVFKLSKLQTKIISVSFQIFSFKLPFREIIPAYLYPKYR